MLHRNALNELEQFLNSQDAAKEMKHRNHRLPMSSYAHAEGVFFFTLCARHQGTPFANSELANEIVESLLWRAKHSGWILYCYCLMPDHLHFVAKLQSDCPCSRDGNPGIMIVEGILEHIAHFKRFTTRQIWSKHGGKGFLWQKSSYDIAIRNDEAVEDAVYYVLNNPVRKGLVTDWQDYPYCGIVDPL